ncbi:MAG: beta-lactamase family protein [Bacteroidota bacterium]|nr:beta-lactamase family protein [Bacteroidota bacterium]
MNFCKLCFILFVFYLSFTGCNSGSASKANTANKDTAIYVMPQPGNIPKADFDKYYNEVNAFYHKDFLARGFNGAILVAKKGRIIFEDYHGYFNLQKKDSLTSHSAFHLASVSKTFTAMAVLKLAELGKLNLTDDVRKYLPEFPYDHVTLKLLLSHRSGLPNYIYFMQKLGWNPKQYCSNEDMLNYLVKFKPPITNLPGTHFEYCNTNYALLGLIIEKASGKSYAHFLQEYFFTPLQMNDTYVFTLADSANAMPSYDWRGRQQGLTYLDTGFGDKNIYSTPEDLLKWDQALYTNQLFTKNTLQEAFTPYSNEKPGIRNYGYGWRMNVYPDGKKIIYHNGWWHGNNTVFIRMIEDSVTIIVLGNKYNRAIYDAKKMVPIFQPSKEMDDEERHANPKDDLMMNVEADSLPAK